MGGLGVGDFIESFTIPSGKPDGMSDLESTGFTLWPSSALKHDFLLSLWGPTHLPYKTYPIRTSPYFPRLPLKYISKHNTHYKFPYTVVLKKLFMLSRLPMLWNPHRRVNLAFQMQLFGLELCQTQKRLRQISKTYAARICT